VNKVVAMNKMIHCGQNVMRFTEIMDM